MTKRAGVLIDRDEGRNVCINFANANVYKALLSEIFVEVLF